MDAAKSKVFTQISREIIVAARNGLPDPEANFQLRNAVAKAKAAGIPNDNIDRAIAKGAGTFGNGEEYEAIRYEGYGPGGVAVLIEALTDNRNRTAADVRVAFSKNGGNLGETGCVSWMFQHKGVVTLCGEIDEERLLEVSVDAGAETYELLEVEEDTPGAQVYTAVENLENLSQILEAAGLPLDRAELRWIPTNTVEVSDPDHARSLLKMMDALEDLDDVQNVTSNFDMTDELMSVSLA